MDNTIIEKLRDDKHYYGDFGKKFISNSDVGTLLEDPLMFKQRKSVKRAAFVVGGYYHTYILEPHKVENFEISKASSRRTKDYKEQAGDNMLLLQHEADNVHEMSRTLLNDEACYKLVKAGDVEYELPGHGVINGLNWKGKADIVNRSLGKVVDLKTTRSVDQFEQSVVSYNYDSQAYVYKQLFGLDLVFIAQEKSTHRFKVVETKPEWYESGKDKVDRACKNFEEFYKYLKPEFYGKTRP